MGSDSYPSLTVTSPHKDDTYEINFADFCNRPGADLRITLGRGEANHIDLPDPERKLSRRQCAFEYKEGEWSVVDEGSANGTYVKRVQDPDQEIDVRWAGREVLEEGDMILVLGGWKGEDTPLFWRLVWHDVPTVRHGSMSPERMEYKVKTQQLFRIQRGSREMVPLSGQQRKLVHCLAQRNLENGGQPAVCSSQQLLQEIWEEPFGHKVGEVNRLVWAIRNKIEEDGGEPQWLVNEDGGYSLRVKVVES